MWELCSRIYPLCLPEPAKVGDALGGGWWGRAGGSGGPQSCRGRVCGGGTGPRGRESSWARDGEARAARRASTSFPRWSTGCWCFGGCLCFAFSNVKLYVFIGALSALKSKDKKCLCFTALLRLWLFLFWDKNGGLVRVFQNQIPLSLSFL